MSLTRCGLAEPKVFLPYFDWLKGERRLVSARRGLKLETPALYEIRVQGSIDGRWSDRLGDLEIRVGSEPDGALVTVLTGQFVDQAALAGTLNILYDLGFPLLSVLCLGSNR